mgnify:CR=1 FL=1
MTVEVRSASQSITTATAAVNRTRDALTRHEPSRQAGPPAGEQVALTPEARALLGATNALAATPEVSLERVDRMRAALADGSYQVDANRVAQAFVRFESALRGAG